MPIDLNAWGHVGQPGPATPPPSPLPPPFTPQFEKPLWHGLNGSSGPLNDAYFATPDTAAYLMARYKATEAVLVPFLADGGPFRSEPMQIYLRFKTPQGRDCDINAGWLASFFRAFPEAEFPKLADTYAQRMIADMCAEADRRT